VDKHLKILGGLFVAVGLSGSIGALFVLTSMTGGGLVTGQWPMMLLVPALGVGITLLILMFSLPTLIEGIGLLRGEEWARRFGLFVAALNLLNFPFGTPVGAYGLWVLARL
jgi:hypothetical protein